MRNGKIKPAPTKNRKKKSQKKKEQKYPEGAKKGVKKVKTLNATIAKIAMHREKEHGENNVLETNPDIPQKDVTVHQNT